MNKLTQESEIIHCKQCGNEFEAMTQEVASYLCPKCPKVKESTKMLDRVSQKYLTVSEVLIQTHDSKLNSGIKGK